MVNPLTILNITNINEITREQFVNIASTTVTIPSLIILFISIFLILLIIGLSLVKRDRGKFIVIWFSTLVLSMVVLMFLIFAPITINNFVENIKGWAGRIK